MNIKYNKNINIYKNTKNRYANEQTIKVGTGGLEAASVDLEEILITDIQEIETQPCFIMNAANV